MISSSFVATWIVSLWLLRPTVAFISPSFWSRPVKTTTTTTRSQLQMGLVPACIRVNDIVYEKKVVVFGVSDDPHTLRVQDLFNEGLVQFTTVFLDLLDDGPDMMEAITHMTGRSQVPCIYMDGKFVGGHDHIFAMNIEGTLGRILEDIGAIPYDRMRDLKHIWRQPAKLNLSGTRNGPYSDADLT
jgi:glutaredoxin